jgi:hypothetical protein
MVTLTPGKLFFERANRIEMFISETVDEEFSA